MSESNIIRRCPSFRRCEIFQWDESPAPVSIEAFDPDSLKSPPERLSLHRFRLDRSSYVLMGEGTTRSFEFGTGWDCTFAISLAAGYRRWTKQNLTENSKLRSRVTIKKPEEETPSMSHGTYQISHDRIHGGGGELAQLDIHRFEGGLFISLGNSQIGVLREWRLEQQSQQKANLHDLHDRETSRPSIIAHADDAVTLLKTIRWLVLELTELLLPERFLTWSTSQGVSPEDLVRLATPTARGA